MLALPGFLRMSGGLQNGEYGVLNDGLEGQPARSKTWLWSFGIAGTSRFGRGGLKDRPAASAATASSAVIEPVVEESDADVIRAEAMGLQSCSACR